jgi:hypothetical protein
MEKIVGNLGLEDCITIPLGRNKILLTEFKKLYMGEFGCSDLVIENKKGYFYYGFLKDRNKIVQDLQEQGYEVQNIFSFIKDKVWEKALEGLYDYAKNTKIELFNKENTYFYRSLGNVGKNPLQDIENKIDLAEFSFEDLANDELVIKIIYNSMTGEEKKIKYNLVDDKFYVDDNSFITEKEQVDLIFDNFISRNDKNKYALYYRYINNKLTGEDIAYKEIAELNKWLEKDDKVNITVVYDLNGEEKESKVVANTNVLLSDLSKDYYEEMFSFWTVDEIKSIIQIKGFKYRNDFYKWNIENLLYKKEG